MTLDLPWFMKIESPLLLRQADDHHAVTVGADEVATEGAVEMVAGALALQAELRFGDEAQMPHHRSPADHFGELGRGKTAARQPRRSNGCHRPSGCARRSATA